jgi:tetratricopeptide (TPR) repeat protein
MEATWMARRSVGHRATGLVISGWVCLTLIFTSAGTKAGDKVVPIESNQRVALLMEAHRYADAIELATQTLEQFAAAVGERHEGTAMCLRNLAQCYTRIGEFAKAEPLYLRAIAIRQQVYSPKDVHTVETMGELADNYERDQEYGKAEELLQKMLEIQKPWGETHVGKARTFERLGIVFTGLGKYQEADELLQRAREMFEKAYGPNYFRNAKCIGEQAELYQKMGESKKAEAFYLRALTMVERARGAQHPDAAAFLNNLGTLYFEMHDYARAKPLYERATALLETAFGPDDPDARLCARNLAILEAATGSGTSPGSRKPSLI